MARVPSVHLWDNPSISSHFHGPLPSSCVSVIPQGLPRPSRKLCMVGRGRRCFELKELGKILDCEVSAKTGNTSAHTLWEDKFK